ncbi:MAG TPA: hypothetical protein VGD61_19370 [Pyrinomonadaceae bacterium]
MKKLSILILVTVLAGIAAAQDKELWPRWDKGKANKMLNSSPWAQTQTDTDTSEMTYSPTTNAGTSSIGQSTTTSQGGPTAGRAVQDNRTDRGASNQSMSVNYHVRFLSARPIRQAFARMIEIQEKDNKSVREQLGPFVERDFSEFIVVTVTFDASDNRFAGPVLQAFSSATHGTLKNQAYLERNDGKRLFIMDYKPPTNDGLGAKFVFPRQVDGEAFLTNAGDVRFVAQVSSKINLSTKYKLQDMMYEGKLEY